MYTVESARGGYRERKKSMVTVIKGWEDLFNSRSDCLSPEERLYGEEARERAIYNLQILEQQHITIGKLIRNPRTIITLVRKLPFWCRLISSPDPSDGETLVPAGLYHQNNQERFF